LHNGRDFLGQDLGGWILAIDLPISLGTLSGLGDEYSEIGAHARVDDTNVGTNDRNLVEHRGIHKEGG
jgi:hypothetical protein